MSLVSRPVAWLTASAVVLAIAATLLVVRLSSVTPVSDAGGRASLYDFSAPSLEGTSTRLASWRGQVALVVNVASECGLAYQYPGLESVYRRFRDQGFVVLAFPSNDFWQEPNDEAGIRQVCATRGVSFPVFGRSHVRGRDRSDIYGFLAGTGETPIWNFAKYLVGRDGRPRAFFGSLIDPSAPEVTAAIESALAEAVPAGPKGPSPD
ncbi:MAG: glutathione peroxidase [Vicinamibacterales bacterium]